MLKTAYTIAWAVVSVGGLIAIPFVRPEIVIILVIVILIMSIGMRLMLRNEKIRNHDAQNRPK
jgi:hypothetical protein